MFLNRKIVILSILFGFTTAASADDYYIMPAIQYIEDSSSCLPIPSAGEQDNYQYAFKMKNVKISRPEPEPRGTLILLVFFDDQSAFYLPLPSRPRGSSLEGLKNKFLNKERMGKSINNVFIACKQ